MGSGDDSQYRPSLGGASKRFWLRFGDHDVELHPGEVIVGRSPRAQVVLDDPLVSRNHARIVLNAGTVTIEDLGSVNGVLVNGVRLTRAHVLKLGDRIVIGQQSFQLQVAEGAAPVPSRDRLGAQTLAGFSLDTDRSESTRQGDALDMLAGVVDKAFAFGRGEEAEKILGNYLAGLLRTVRGQGDVTSELAEKAATYAVRIAEATRKGSWIDYTFELYTILRRPLPAPIVERLYGSLRSIPGVNMKGYREYLDALRELQATLGPSERFLVRRIQGLEALISK